MNINNGTLKSATVNKEEVTFDLSKDGKALMRDKDGKRVGQYDDTDIAEILAKAGLIKI